jgi:hypothetical protein
MARNEFNEERRDRFLRALAEHGQVNYACKLAGCSTVTAYQRRQRDEEFAQAWKDALEDFADHVERSAVDWAVEGIPEPVYQQGRRVMDAVVDEHGRAVLDDQGKPVMRPAVIRRRSERLMETLLKGNRPNKYRENVKIDASVTTAGVLVVGAPSPSIDAWLAEHGRRDDAEDE